MTSTRYKYSAREPGFFRLSMFGWRFVAYDTRRTWVIYSDRTHGVRVGRFLFRCAPFPGE